MGRSFMALRVPFACFIGVSIFVAPLYLTYCRSSSNPHSNTDTVDEGTSRLLSGEYPHQQGSEENLEGYSI